MKSCLQTSNLSIGYHTSKSTLLIAQKINLDLKTGKLITLIGANGIGKSTLLKTLAGIQKPAKGTVFLNGKPVNEYSALERAKNLSLVLTEKLPPSNLTVYELVALGRQPYTNWIGKLGSLDFEKINQAIAQTGIEGFAEKKYFELSDGQLQKALIARALAQDTPLVILDEPTTHLDLLHKVSVFKLLKKLSEEAQKCILFSTHDVDLAIQLSDEMIVMTPEGLFHDQPCNLIEKGVFDTLFKNEALVFDKQKGTFVVM